MHSAQMMAVLVASQVLPCVVPAAEASPGGSTQRVPLIYSTDLFHPHDDPDDHFDLATVFAMPELDVKAVLLDLGARQEKKPGRIPLEQMFKLTGRRVPYATGLNGKLKSPDDAGRDQPEAGQAAVELLLRTLRESPRPVTIVTAGSIRDVCAAFNRDPDLLRNKVARLYINIGSLLETQGEWNELLDPQAYIGLMRSGLPIYWCPCRPTKENRTSHYAFKHAEVLEGMPLPLLNWFVYALQVVRPDELDPMTALGMDLRPWRQILLGQERNMWCTGSLIHAAGRTIYQVDGRWVAAASPPAGGKAESLFTFVPVRVEISDVKGRARTKWTEDTSDPNMHLYRVIDAEHHEAALKSCLRELLHRFPLAVSAEVAPVGAR